MFLMDYVSPTGQNKVFELEETDPSIKRPILDCDWKTIPTTTTCDVSPQVSTRKHLPGAADEASLSDESKMTPLPTNFVPGPFDVICGRGAKVKLHPGNVLFRKKIQESVKAYADADSKIHKSLVVSAVVEFFLRRGTGGFVKQSGGMWHSVSEYLAREKTGQAFRDQLSDSYRSATKAKRRRWREEGQKAKLKDDVQMAVQRHEGRRDHEMDDQVDDDPFFDELVGVNVNAQIQMHRLRVEKIEVDRVRARHSIPEHVYEMDLEILFMRNNIRLLEGLKLDSDIQESLVARRTSAS